MRIQIDDRDKKDLNTLYYALLSGLVMILLILALLIPNKSVTDNVNADLLTAIGIVVAIVMPSIGIYRSQKILERIKNTSEEEHLSDLRSAHIIKWASIEGPGLINTLFYWSFGISICLFMAIFMIVLLLFNRPHFDY